MNSFNADIESSELHWQRDSYAREMAQDSWDELQGLDWEVEPEPLPRSTVEHPCCINPSSFTAHPSLERDPHTGYLEGTFYRCDHCGTRICEEDYAAMVEYETRRMSLVREMVERPVPDEPMQEPRRAA